MKIKYLLLFLILISACKKERAEAKLIKECSGIYMFIEGEYFTVCNRDDFKNIPSGTMMKIKHKTVKNEACDPIISCACCILSFYPNKKIIEAKIIN